MATNQILPFCGTDTGTNLPTQGDYLADPNRSIGNSPGVASSKLNNKPARQATFIASQIAQYVSDKTGNDVLDDGVTAKLLAVIKSAFTPLPPVFTRYTSGTGNHNSTYYFFIASGNATAAATYTNNGFTYTVVTTIALGTLLRVTGTGVPAASGTLTKSAGTGDSTLTFYSVRAPVNLGVKLVGGGGGGAGSGVGGNGGAGGAGGNTTFGTALLTANGGAGGTGAGGQSAGGTITVNSPAVNTGSMDGSNGGGTQISSTNVYLSSTQAGVSFFGGAGSGQGGGAGAAAKTNSGSGGAGGGTSATTAYAGASGAAGGFIDAAIPNPTTLTNGVFAYAVGSAGTAGTAGTSGSAGGLGGAGVIITREDFQ